MKYKTEKELIELLRKLLLEGGASQRFTSSQPGDYKTANFFRNDGESFSVFSCSCGFY
nr:hypothetical protein [Bacillus licheniformis]